MSMFSPEQKKQIFTFFQWEDGKEYKLKIKYRQDTNFANGKPTHVLECSDQETGETFERKNEFGLMTALVKMGDRYKGEDTIVVVKPCLSEKKREWQGKQYDIWNFGVKVDGEVSGQTAEEKEELGF